MSFLDSLNEQLTAMEQEVQALPGELDSIVARIDRGKLQAVLTRLEQVCDQLYEKQFAAQMRGVIPLSIILELQSLSITPITSEDRAKWRKAYKSEVRVVIGEGRVEVVTVSAPTEKYQTKASQPAPAAEKQSSIVLRWEQYLKLLDEIGKLIAG